MIDAALAVVARRGRWALIGGLAVGVAAPGLARAMAPLVTPMVAGLLFLAVLRLPPEGLRAALGGVPRAMGAVLTLQLALPLAAGGALWGAGLIAHPLAAGLVLTLAAAPITGAPHMAAMIGRDPTPALRLLVLGTLLLPLTAPPVMAILPGLAGDASPLAAALRLGVIVAGSALAAAALRRLRPPRDEARLRARVDGLAAIGLGVVVVGLMAAVGPALGEPGRLVPALGLACAACWAIQWPVALAGDPGLAVAAGNRNAALMLGALGPEGQAEVALFVGCYQVPMYLTPLLLPRLIGRGR